MKVSAFVYEVAIGSKDEVMNWRINRQEELLRNNPESNPIPSLIQSPNNRPLSLGDDEYRMFFIHSEEEMPDHGVHAHVLLTLNKDVEHVTRVLEEVRQHGWERIVKCLDKNPR